jgi:adenosylmethionine-8-amino-7-oxononanoate aminotransferase
MERKLVDENWLNLVAKCSVVQNCWVLGSVFVVDLKAEKSGYESLNGTQWIGRFLAENIHIRPLGNVLYFMLNYNIEKEEVNLLFERVVKVLSCSRYDKI